MRLNELMGENSRLQCIINQQKLKNILSSQTHTSFESKGYSTSVKARPESVEDSFQSYLEENLRFSMDKKVKF